MLRRKAVLQVARGRDSGITPRKERIIRGGSEVLILEKHISEVRIYEDICPTLGERLGTGGGNMPLILESNQNHATIKDAEVCPCLPAAMGLGGGGYVPMIVTAYGFDERAKWATEEKAQTLSVGGGRGMVQFSDDDDRRAADFPR